jgi:hypothetical protein
MRGGRQPFISWRETVGCWSTFVLTPETNYQATIRLLRLLSKPGIPEPLSPLLFSFFLSISLKQVYDTSNWPWALWLHLFLVRLEPEWKDAWEERWMHMAVRAMVFKRQIGWRCREWPLAAV